MEKEILIFTGLHDEIVSEMLVIAAKKVEEALGLRTEVLDLKWKKEKSFKEIEKILFPEIEKRKEVYLLAISAGMVAALIARNKYGREKIPKLISLCGWSRAEIGLNKTEKEKLDNLRERAPAFGEAINELTEIYNNFTPKDWEEMMVFVAERDQFVPESCCVVEGMKKVELSRMEHVGGIIAGLGRVEEMRDFIRG